MGRPSNRAVRKSELVEAALHAIEGCGVDGLRIRDVAQLAGVSTATIHYYFDDLDGLLDDIHSVVVSRYISQRCSAVAGFDDARDQLTVTIRGGVPDSPDDLVTVAAYQVGVARRKNPSQVLLRSHYNDQQVALYVGILGLGVSQGHFTLALPALEIAQNIVALEDAYALHMISRTAALPHDRCLDLIFSYARSATACPEIGVE